MLPGNGFICELLAAASWGIDMGKYFNVDLPSGRGPALVVFKVFKCFPSVIKLLLSNLHILSRLLAGLQEYKYK